MIVKCAEGAIVKSFFIAINAVIADTYHKKTGTNAIKM
jgi:hypothetical protein